MIFTIFMYIIVVLWLTFLVGDAATEIDRERWARFVIDIICIVALIGVAVMVWSGM